MKKRETLIFAVIMLGKKKQTFVFYENIDDNVDIE